LEATLPRLDAARQFPLRRQIALELARLLAKLHDAGITHHDLHAGNFLIRYPDDRCELFLIDLHAVHLGQPLTDAARWENLIMLNRWFIVRAHRSERWRFWREYLRARRQPMNEDEVRQTARELEKRTWQSNIRFWHGRDRRCLASNKYYQRLRSAGIEGHAVRDLDSSTLTELCRAADSVFQRPDVKLLKDSRSSTVAELMLPVNGVPHSVIFKRFRMRSWHEPWASLLRRPAALRSWIQGQGLRERGLPTARPLAILQRREHGLWYEGYLLTEKVPEALDLRSFVGQLHSRTWLQRYIDQIARLIRELHRRRLAHRDLKAANILMSPVRCPWSLLNDTLAPEEQAAWLIDLAGLTLHRRLSRRRRVHNLARLHASFHQSPLLTRTDKLRFLRTYLQTGLFGRAGWKRWWRAIAAATEAKVLRNLRNGRPLA
jgi:tRNA A-37 threonylcarbamoyl transferase component Bud32